MAVAAPPKRQNFDDLRSWLNSRGSVVKASGSLPDLEDDGKPASPGERSSENSSDVKKLMPHVNVETAPDNPDHGDTDKPVPDSGLMQTSVGKMPEVEKAVKIVTEENEKVSSSNFGTADELAAGIASLEKIASAMGIMSTAAAGSVLPTKPAQTQSHQQVPPAGSPTSQPAKVAAESGATPEQQALVASYAKFGSDRAELLTNFLRGQMDSYTHLCKLAADGALDAAMGGGAAPPGESPPDASAMAPDAAAQAPPAGDSGGGDGAPSADELASALAEMGVTPDVLMQAAQKLQQMAGGQAPPDAAPEEKAAAVAATAEMVKLASDTQSHMRTGQFRLKPAADGSRERVRRDEAKKYIDEMLRYASK